MSARYEFTVRCYRCGEQLGEHRDSDAARETAIEDFKQQHRARCGSSASFMVTRTYQHASELVEPSDGRDLRGGLLP